MFTFILNRNWGAPNYNTFVYYSCSICDLLLCELFRGDKYSFPGNCFSFFVRNHSRKYKADWQRKCHFLNKRFSARSMCIVSSLKLDCLVKTLESLQWVFILLESSSLRLIQSSVGFLYHRLPSLRKNKLLTFKIITFAHQVSFHTVYGCEQEYLFYKPI